MTAGSKIIILEDSTVDDCQEGNRDSDEEQATATDSQNQEEGAAAEWQRQAQPPPEGQEQSGQKDAPEAQPIEDITSDDNDEDGEQPVASSYDIQRRQRCSMPLLQKESMKHLRW